MRKPFLDNVRGGIVLLVVVYHAVYLLNSVGVISNVSIPGIPQADLLLYAAYPWFMVCLFAIAGASARYALDARGAKPFLKSKLRRVLLPSVAGIFLIGWLSGYVTYRYNPAMFGEAPVPVFVKLLVFCIAGIGPLWFLHELFVCDLTLLLVRRLDRRGALLRLGSRAELAHLLLLALPFWGSAQILNTPVMEGYRHGIYIFSFLLGYFVLSHERVQALLARYAHALLLAACALGAAYTAQNWGLNYAAMESLKAPLTNAFAWLGTLAVLACGKRFFDRETRFTRFMRRNGFAIFALHYPLMALSACFFDLALHLPAAMIYPLLLLTQAVLLPPIVALIRRIPPLRLLLLGEA